MARQGKVASRYARAVFEVAKRKDDPKLVGELTSFASVLVKNAELQRALVTGPFRPKQKVGIIEDLAKKLGLSQDATRVLLVLNENGRLSALKAIVEFVEKMQLEEAGVAAITVRSVDVLAPDVRTKIEEKFKKVLGKKVHAEYLEDSSLIGGLQISAGGRSYDGSVAGWLNGVEEQLVGGQI